jgi:hypothetical protein
MGSLLRTKGTTEKFKLLLAIRWWVGGFSSEVVPWSICSHLDIRFFKLEERRHTLIR